MIWLIVLLCLIGLITLRVILRGYFWKTRTGEKLNFKEFMKRWKIGIEGITPLQSTKTQLMGIWITLTGIIAGIIINILLRMKGQWVWITIVLTGSLILVIMNFLTTLQKYWKFKQIDEQIKLLEVKNDSCSRNKSLRFKRRN